MFCTNCGNRIEDGSAFCTKCGKPVEGEGAVVPAPPSTPTPEAAAKAPSRSGGLAASAAATPMAGNIAESARPVAPQGKRPRLGVVVGIVVAAIVLVVAAAAVVLMLALPGGLKSLFGGVEETTITLVEKNSSSASSSSSSASSSASSSSSSSSAESASQDAQYLLPDAATRLYTEAELEALSDWELYVARNEIYARHGRGFKNADLAAYFSSQPWYSQQYTPEQFDAMPSPLNDVERANSTLIKSVEERRGSQYR